MDFLNEVKTIEERDLILSEIEYAKRRDYASIRNSMVESFKSIDLNDLKKQLKSLEVVKIILAIEPTVGIVELVDNFFKNNLKKKVIFDFEVDKEIIGGMQLIYQGKYLDLSIEQ